MITAQLFSKKCSLLIVMFSIVFIFPMLQQAHATMPKPIISCTLSVPHTSFITNEILLDFTVTNLSNKSISLLTWYSPLEGFLSNLFLITNLDSNELLNYQGPMVKRGQPTQDDFLPLAVNESITNQINLAQAYQLTKGSFSLQLHHSTIQLRLQDMQLTNVNCSPNVVDFEIH